MAYYTALINEWATLTGTTEQKLAAINAMTVAGPNVDVAVSTVAGYLALNGDYLSLQAFSQTATNSNSTHDAALAASKLLMTILGLPNAPDFQMSIPATYTAVKNMMDAILAQETASPGTTGFTQAIHDGLLALCATTIPWWQANGYTSPFNANDLAVAGNLT